MQTNKLKALTLSIAMVLLATCKSREYNDAEVRAVEMYSGLDSWPLLPADQSRDFQCPVQYRTDSKVSEEKNWNALKVTLAKIPQTADLKVTLIEIRRTPTGPKFRYFSNGTQDATFDPWSSSKFMAFAVLASRLRSETNGVLGLDGSTLDTARGGKIPLGDLVTLMTVSPEDYLPADVYTKLFEPYNSNNISSWAKNAAGRKFATSLIQGQWLKRTQESFGGGYAKYDSDLGETFFAENGERFQLHSSGLGAHSTVLSTFTISEFLKRLVLHNELPPDEQMPHLKKEDVKTLLYGTPPATSRYFKDRLGGLAHGPSTYLHRALGLTSARNFAESYKNDDSEAALKARGQWRVFTKLGLGPRYFGNTRRNDFAWHGYACMPAFNGAGELIEKESSEFVISTFLSANPSRTNEESDALLSEAIHNIVNDLRTGRYH